MTISELRAALLRDGWSVDEIPGRIWARHSGGVILRVERWFRFSEVNVWRPDRALAGTWDIHAGGIPTAKAYAKAYKVATKLTRNHA